LLIKCREKKKKKEKKEKKEKKRRRERKKDNTIRYHFVIVCHVSVMKME